MPTRNQCALAVLLVAASAWYTDSGTRSFRAARLDRIGTVESLTKAVRLAPQEARYWDDLGRLQQNAGVFASAVDSLRQARRWAPDQAQYARELSALLFDMGGAASRDEAMAAVRLAPTDPYSMVMLGSLDLVASDRSAALQQFRHALDLNPDLAGQIYQELWGVVPNAQILHDVVPANSVGYVGYISFLASAGHWPELGQSLASLSQRSWRVPPADVLPALDDLTQARQWDQLAALWPHLERSGSTDPLDSPVAGHALAWGAAPGGMVSTWTEEISGHGQAIHLQVKAGIADSGALGLVSHYVVVADHACLEFEVAGQTRNWRAYANPEWDWSDADTGALLASWGPGDSEGWYQHTVTVRPAPATKAIRVSLTVPGSRGLDPRVEGDLTVVLPEARSCR